MCLVWVSEEVSFLDRIDKINGIDGVDRIDRKEGFLGEMEKSKHQVSSGKWLVASG